MLFHACVLYALDPLWNFRTGCGERLAPGCLEPAVLEPIPTGTSMLAGAVSATYHLYLEKAVHSFCITFIKGQGS